jgi:mRNA interferase RelE/StbE
MEKYKIEIKRSAQKEIQSLPKKDAQRIISKIQSLADDPRGPDSKKLSAQERFRVRVGQYRILYEIHDLVLLIVVVKVAHRRWSR